MTTLRLILSGQLNPRHSWFARVDPAVVYVLMEVRQETDYIRGVYWARMPDYAALNFFQYSY